MSNQTINFSLEENFKDSLQFSLKMYLESKSECRKIKYAIIFLFGFMELFLKWLIKEYLHELLIYDTKNIEKTIGFEQSIKVLENYLQKKQEKGMDLEIESRNLRSNFKKLDHLKGLRNSLMHNECHIDYKYVVEQMGYILDAAELSYKLLSTENTNNILLSGFIEDEGQRQACIDLIRDWERKEQFAQSWVREEETKLSSAYAIGESVELPDGVEDILSDCSNCGGEKTRLFDINRYTCKLCGEIQELSHCIRCNEETDPENSLCLYCQYMLNKD